MAVCTVHVSVRLWQCKQCVAAVQQQQQREVGVYKVTHLILPTCTPLTCCLHVLPFAWLSSQCPHLLAFRSPEPAHTHT